ncbi:hypothetical protein L207DRAFT_575541 [Hyaloscypha variabilis F]|uniref:Uncharacterized protein n=1 Tax=Hyaloscypha variabilis (strain UAMH 11265 / GT02V1 / F) TaxID=1149755 RepID=A0A2J6SDQ3_HYAVF|nr:hypothetical protein L207DRAFT_575541 [Hyaloscypha variabilis F]
MSVFAAAAMALPPRYSSTRTQPPPYKGDVGSFPGSSSTSTAPSMPPPVYKTTSNTSSRSSSPAPSFSTIATAEPPQYASIISAPRPKPQPSATRQQRPSTPTWKDPYVETDAADTMYELQQRGSRQREKEEEDDDTKNWCWGCFWWYYHVPSDAQGVHWSAYGPYIFF